MNDNQILHLKNAYIHCIKKTLEAVPENSCKEYSSTVDKFNDKVCTLIYSDRYHETDIGSE